MPDGIVPPDEGAGGTLAADAAEAGLVQSVRRNLVLWSGGTTLIILLVLAVALFLAVAGSLARSGTDQLEDAMTVPRAGLWTSSQSVAVDGTQRPPMKFWSSGTSSPDCGRSGP